MRRLVVITVLVSVSLLALADGKAENRRGYQAGFARCQVEPFGLSPDFTKMTVQESKGWHAGCDAARVAYHARESSNPENGIREDDVAPARPVPAQRRSETLVDPHPLPEIRVKSCDAPGATEFDCALESAFRQQKGVRVVSDTAVPTETRTRK